MSLSDILKTFGDEHVIVKEEGKYVEKDKYGVSLKGVLQRGRLKLRKTVRPRPQGVSFRPSGITYHYCRRLKIGQLGGFISIYDESPTPKTQLVFDMGHAIHDIIQGYFWDIGILRGDFQCIKCDKIYNDLVAPTECPSGKTTHTRKHLVYKEVIAKAPDYLINGRCDGILMIENEEHIFDIKSIANRALKTPDQYFCFEDLEDGPKEAHIIQLTLYMWMLGIERGHLLYVSKNDHQIKTFAIPYDYMVIEPYITEISNLISTSKELAAGNRVDLPNPCGREDCPCDEILSKMPI